MQRLFEQVNAVRLDPGGKPDAFVERVRCVHVQHEQGVGTEGDLPDPGQPLVGAHYDQDVAGMAERLVRSPGRLVEADGNRMSLDLGDLQGAPAEKEGSGAV